MHRVPRVPQVHSRRLDATPRPAFLASAILLICALAATFVTPRSAEGQGFDSDLFLDPISSGDLVEWFGPAIDDGATWTRVLELHDDYLRRQRHVRELELEPWMQRGDALVAKGGATEATVAVLVRSLPSLRRRLADLDDAFLSQVAAGVGERVAPMVEWLRVRRALAACECGLDEQTEDVSFALLSYSEVALDAPVLAWAAPEAATAFAAYDAQVMRWGKAFRKSRAALADARAQESERALAEAESDLEPVGESDPDPEAVDLVLEEHAAAADDDELEGDAVAEDGATDLQRLGLRQARRLAFLGRSSLPIFEAALSPRARLLMRLRLIQRVARFAEPGESARDGEASGDDDASSTSTLRGDLAKLRRLLDQTIDPRTNVGIDLAAVESFAARHWEEIAAISEEMLKITRRASNVRFAKGREPTAEEAAGDQRRLLELAQQWKPLASAATLVLTELVENGARLAAALAQGSRRGASDSSVSTTAVQGASGSAEDSERLVPTPRALDGSSKLDSGACLLTLGAHRPGVVSSARIVETLGVRALAPGSGDDDLLLLVPTLRAELLEKAWTELAPLVEALELALKEDAARDDAGAEQPLSEDPTHARLRDALRRAIGDVDATLIGELEQIVADPEHRLRLRLLAHSTAIKAAMRRVAAVEGAHRIVAGPVDLADLALSALFDVRPWSTLFVSGEHLENELAPAPSRGGSAEGASNEEDRALRDAIATAILESHAELLAAAHATGEALLELDLATPREAPTIRLGRLVEIFRYDSDPENQRQRPRGGTARQLAASRHVAAAVRHQVAVESQALESAIRIAGAESRLGERLRQEALRASMWPMMRDLHDDGLGVALAGMEAVGRFDGRSAEAVDAIRTMGCTRFAAIVQFVRTAADAAGVVFSASDPQSVRRWERVLARAQFDVAELNSTLLIELGRHAGDADAPLRQQLGLHGHVGNVMGKVNGPMPAGHEILATEANRPASPRQGAGGSIGTAAPVDP